MPVLCYNSWCWPWFFRLFCVGEEKTEKTCLCEWFCQTYTSFQSYVGVCSKDSYQVFWDLSLRLSRLKYLLQSRRNEHHVISPCLKCLSCLLYDVKLFWEQWHMLSQKLVTEFWLNIVHWVKDSALNTGSCMNLCMLSWCDYCGEQETIISLFQSQNSTLFIKHHKMVPRILTLKLKRYSSTRQINLLCSV